MQYSALLFTVTLFLAAVSEEGSEGRDSEKNVIIVLNLAQPVSDIILLELLARSQNHQLGSYELNNVSLSCVDDKR